MTTKKQKLTECNIIAFDYKIAGNILKFEVSNYMYNIIICDIEGSVLLDAYLEEKYYNKVLCLNLISVSSKIEYFYNHLIKVALKNFKNQTGINIYYKK